jgi:hypothetical protein
VGEGISVSAAGDLCVTLSPADGIDWLEDGIDWPADGIDWLADGIDWPADGIDWPADGIDWPVEATAVNANSAMTRDAASVMNSEYLKSLGLELRV